MAEKYKNDADMLEMSCPIVGPCLPQEAVIKNVRLATAYVPFQKLDTLFSPIEALKRGTVFPELCSPYVGISKKAKLP
jgi:Spore coat associated protein JA (CotJA).